MNFRFPCTKDKEKEINRTEKARKKHGIKDTEL